MRKYLLAGLAGAACAALATTYLIAQVIVPGALSGNECWNAGQGPGGPSTGFLCVNQVRSGHANVVMSAITGNFTVGATSGNFTITGTPNMTQLTFGGNILITAAPSTATITLPPSPFPDGGIMGFCNSTSGAFVNTLTVQGNTGQTSPASATLPTLAIGACGRYQFNQSQLTWYRIQ